MYSHAASFRIFYGKRTNRQIFEDLNSSVRDSRLPPRLIHADV